ncbi:MAG: hypothetical protein E6K81_13470 [Candidatus Eisenbacteria bacterium]|uniref:YdhG-like domain-containing protein n=1 Tax=Eiseniibacteriota bacterium TaxID=2212470 RepID=A0A538U2E7_UNCEI|nr:MAG: hypothetical protein E6K81_13470 [Candidatus Eisenbacteria bacterium]
MGQKDPRVDAYIARSAPFAQPILKRMRKVVHAGCPGAEETLKWGAPAFMYKGLLCGMAAFKQHCTFGFWKHALVIAKDRVNAQEAAWGQFGRITDVSELPSDTMMLGWVKKAARLNDEGVKVPRKPTPAGGRPLSVPAYFMSAVRKNGKALATFKGFSPSCKREYVEWVTEAKTDETRSRRLATAVEWMAQGKARNWKYLKK